MSQNPHAIKDDKDTSLELAIGKEVRLFRNKLGMTVTEVAKLANMSPGMLSKIEHGLTSPSLATIKNLSRALNVPVTALFRQYEEERDVSFVRRGEGIRIERRGTRSGHQYRLLGHSVGGLVSVEPYLVTLTEESDVFPAFQHPGVEFIHLLEGRLSYRHGNMTYELEPGDSLYFDSDAPHGPENLIELPIRFLSIIAYPANKD